MPQRDVASSVLAQLIEKRFGHAGVCGETERGLETLTGMLRHRSHRSFEDRPVEDRLLQSLFACALSSPSKSDLQQADIIRVKDETTRRALAALIPSMPWVKSAPVFLVFCGNGRRIRQVSELRGLSFANDHLDAFFNAAVDAAIVMATFITAAEAAGLGCCPISAVRDDCDALDRLLGLPELVFPVAGLCVGYPREPGRISQRLPMEVTVHTDRFDESQLESRIEAYDARRAAAMPEDERYHWSEARARQYSEPQRSDFGSYIRRKGFDLG